MPRRDLLRERRDAVPKAGGGEHLDLGAEREHVACAMVAVFDHHYHFAPAIGRGRRRRGDSLRTARRLRGKPFAAIGGGAEGRFGGEQVGFEPRLLGLPPCRETEIGGALERRIAYRQPVDIRNPEDADLFAAARGQIQMPAFSTRPSGSTVQSRVPCQLS